MQIFDQPIILTRESVEILPMSSKVELPQIESQCSQLSCNRSKIAVSSSVISSRAWSEPCLSCLSAGPGPCSSPMTICGYLGLSSDFRRRLSLQISEGEVNPLGATDPDGPFVESCIVDAVSMPSNRFEKDRTQLLELCMKGDQRCDGKCGRDREIIIEFTCGGM